MTKLALVFQEGTWDAIRVVSRTPFDRRDVSSGDGWNPWELVNCS